MGTWGLGFRGGLGDTPKGQESGPRRRSGTSRECQGQERGNFWGHDRAPFPSRA